MQNRRTSRIRTWLQAGVQRVNRLSVSLRLGILLGLLCLLMAGIGLVGLQGMHSAGDGIKAVYKDRIVPLQQIKTISDGYARITTTAMKVRFGDFSPEQGAEAIGRARKLIARAWKNFQTHPKEGEEAELTSRFEQLQQPAEAAMDELETMAKSDANPVDLEAVGKFTSQVILPSLDPLQGVLEQLASLQLDHAKSVYEDTDKGIVLARTLVWATIGTGLLLALVLGLAVTWSVLAQLGGEPRDAARLANAVAEGDLTLSRTHFRGGPESLMAQLGSMQQRLAEVVRSVFHVSSTVANASREIAQGNYDLSARTEEQASALQQTAASMEQLSSTVEKNAAHSRQAQALAQTASNVASQGGQVVGRVVDNMHSIRRSAYRISDIIAVIEGIAFQTNILALNAAVEAARAGEQGRGFAVVASEVRTLASRSAAAAKEIKQLITDSVQHVDTGAGLVNEAGSTMNEIVRSIASVCTIMSEISTASQDQASGVSQVGYAVGQMDKTTQANAALVEQMAASAASLSSQANELVQIVSIFKMDAEPELALTY